MGLRESFYAQEKRERINKEVSELLPNSDYVLCTYDINSSTYAITSAYVNAHNNGKTHQLLRFKQYEENGVIKTLTNGRYKLTGLIPNYEFYGMTHVPKSEDGATVELKVPFSFITKG